MDEQDAQWNASIDDWERVAAASQEVTAVSAKKALAIGREDERDAIEARASLEDSVYSLECTGHGEEKIASGELEVVKRPRRRKNKTKSKTRRSVRTEDRKDPPGKIRRENSQTASDVLMQMRMASRKARTLKV
jgi:hypothetical protein